MEPEQKKNCEGTEKFRILNIKSRANFIMFTAFETVSDEGEFFILYFFLAVIKGFIN